LTFDPEKRTAIFTLSRKFEQEQRYKETREILVGQRANE
jgi:hypothetical protein